MRSNSAAYLTLLITIFLISCTLSMTSSASAKEKPKKDEAGAPLHESLDRRYRFSKKFQSELGIFGGDYLGDAWRNTWNVGARYQLHLNNTFSIGGEYLFNQVRADGSSAFGASLTTDHSHLLDAEVAISNDCALRIGHSIIECDLFATFGAGAISINRIWKPAAVLGGGMKIYTPLPWLSVRFDVTTILHETPTPGRDAFHSDMVMDVGVSFLFPVHTINEGAQ